MSGLADFKKDLQPVEEAVLTEWAKSAQRTNLASLRAAQGPGGASLAPNKTYTAKRKGHDRVGFGKTGQMAAGLTVEDAVDIRMGARSGKATVYAGAGSTDLKLNAFIKGQADGSGRMVWVTETLPNGKQKKYQRPMLRVPPRDFVGLAQADLDAAAENAAESVLRSWGFR